MRRWWLASCLVVACGGGGWDDEGADSVVGGETGLSSGDTADPLDTEDSDTGAPLDTATGSDTALDSDTDEPLTLGVLRLITPGSFTMGCEDPRDVAGGLTSCSRSDERPSREVTLSKSFWMMESELTQSMWTRLGFANPSAFSGNSKPAENVNWWEAVEAANQASRVEGWAECYALSGCSGTVGDDWVCMGVSVTSSSGHPKDCEGWRLPTEAEWEYAARAGSSLPYSGGSDPDQVAWYEGNTAPSETQDVCTTPTPRNGWGLCDMSGNVREWTWDWHAPGYSGAATSDPTGPDSGELRTARGGHRASKPEFVRVAYRNRPTPDRRRNSIGFRLVRSAPDAP